MVTRFATFALFGLTFVGCGGTNNSTSGNPNDGAVPGHALHFNANLKQQDGELQFMTPSVSIIKVAATDVAGKPYLVASFPAGFSPGNDPPIHSFWGTVPSDLTIRYSTPSTYADGPYDMVLVVYANTPITDAIKTAPAQDAPPARNGDMATFTADMSAVHSGDPSIPAGLIRLNVENADADAAVENKVAVDPSQIAAALVNTVMIIP